MESRIRLLLTRGKEESDQKVRREIEDVADILVQGAWVGGVVEMKTGGSVRSYEERERMSTGKSGS